MPRGRLSLLLRWLPGTVILAALAVLALRSAEWERFGEVIRRAEPSWLLLTVVLQAGTYLCAAAALQRGVKASGVHKSLMGLVPLGFAKLFIDQVVPTGGLGGSVLVVRAMERRGVSRGVATAAVVVNTLAFYASYAIAVAGALAVLWLRHGVSRAILILLTLFAIYATAMPILILWVVYGGRRAHPRLAKIPGLENAIAAMREAPRSTLRHPMLFVESILLQLAIILLDAWTLDALLRAIGHPAPFGALYTSFILASIAGTLSLLPGGVGSFEAGSVASMRYLGVPLEVAIAGTVVFRMVTLWIPLLPGMWYARHYMGGSPGRPEARPTGSGGPEPETPAGKPAGGRRP